jgi:hypothetical protein
MRNLIVIVLSFCFSTKLFSQDFANSNQQWIHYYSQIDLNQKNRIGFDGGFRWKDACSEPALFLVRVSYWQKIKPNLSLGIGIAHTGSFSNREINTLELRPYQELLYLKKKEKSTIQIRYRLEERLFSDFHEATANTNRFVLRNRFAFSYTFFVLKPFKKFENTSLHFFLGEELFMNLKLNSETNWFDQNRFMAGPVLKLNQKLTLQFVYNFQFASAVEVNTFRLTHVYWLSLRHSLDFSKKETTE